MSRLLDPSRTVAVILGSQDWRKAGLREAPSHRRSALHFLAYLLDRAPYGLGLEPDFIVNLFDDPSAAGDQLERINNDIAALIRERHNSPSPISDVLIYYVGHGECEAGKHLRLLIRRSISSRYGISVDDLAETLRISAPQQRRIIILDCCFSEAAAISFGPQAAGLDDVVAAAAAKDLMKPTPDLGTILLCSSLRTDYSVGDPNARYTLFTGALLGALRGGLAHSEDIMISFGDLRNHVWNTMIRDYGDNPFPPRPALHQPGQEQGDLTQLPAFPNVAAHARRLGLPGWEVTPDPVGGQVPLGRRILHGFDAVRSSSSEHISRLKLHEGDYLCVGVSTLKPGAYFIALFELKWDGACLQARHMCLKSRPDSDAKSVKDVSFEAHEEIETYQGTACLVGRPSFPMLMIMVEPLERLDEIMAILVQFVPEPPPTVLFGSYLGVGKTQQTHPAGANLALIRLNTERASLPRASHSSYYREVSEACSGLAGYVDFLKHRWISEADLERFLRLLGNSDVTYSGNPEMRDAEIDDIYHHLTIPPIGIADDRALRPPFASLGKRRKLKRGRRPATAADPAVALRGEGC